MLCDQFRDFDRHDGVGKKLENGIRQNNNRVPVTGYFLRLDPFFVFSSFRFDGANRQTSRTEKPGGLPGVQTEQDQVRRGAPDLRQMFVPLSGVSMARRRWAASTPQSPTCGQL